MRECDIVVMNKVEDNMDETDNKIKEAKVQAKVKKGEDYIKANWHALISGNEVTYTMLPMTVFQVKIIKDVHRKKF